MQTSSKRTLDEAIDAFQNSANARIETATLQWPEMTALLKQLGLLSRDETSSFSIKEELCISATKSWIFKLWDGPVVTSDERTGYEQLVERLEEAIQVNGAKTTHFEQMLQCVLAIGRLGHPAALFLEDWITTQDVLECSENSPRAGEPAIALICKMTNSKDSIQQWLASENLFASVETYSRLRRSPAFETIVLFGPPNRYESSRWVGSPDSDFKAQWLLTAPPASKVVLLSWPSHPRLNLDFVGPWQGFETPTISPMDEMSDVSPLPAFEFIEKPRENLSAFDFANEIDAVSARQYEILGHKDGLWVFFDDNLGPRPRILRSDFSQTFTPATKQELRPGTHLVFRSHEVERQHLLKASELWWSEKYSEHSFAKAEEFKQALKQKVQTFLDLNGLDELKRRFGIAGLSKEYSIQLHSRIVAPDYVAPLNSDNYEAVCRAVDYRAPSGSFNLLSKLRTARQQAGLGMVQELIFKLQAAAEAGELDELTELGFAKIHDDVLGELFISTIAHLTAEKALVPLSKLGRPVDKGGSLWLR